MKLAFYFQQNGSGVDRIARKMADAQSLAAHQAVSVFVLAEHMALGCVETQASASKIPFFYQAANGNILAISGVPIDMQLDTAGKLKSVVNQDYQQATKILESLDGAFVAIFWDNINRKLVVVTDFLGYQPLYIYQDDQTLILSSEVKGIMASGKVDLQDDPVFWGGFFYLGSSIADRTGIRDIKKTQAGSTYVFDPAVNKLQVKAYFQWPAPRRNLKLLNVDLDAFVEILVRNMKAYTQHTDQAVMLLSGGYDSRVMLSLLAQNKMAVKSLIVEHPDELDNLDGKLALEVANRLGVSYTQRMPPRNFYSTKDYWEYLIKNEMVTPSLYLFIANITPFITPGLVAVWEGVSVGLSVSLIRHGHHTFESYLDLNLKMKGSSGYQAAENILTKEYFAAMNAEFTQALEAEKNKYADDGFGVYEFALRNWTRNRTAHSPYSVLSNNVLAFTPGHCREFISMLAEIPIEHKLYGNLIDEVYRRYFKNVCDIPVCSGGKMFYPSGHKPIKFKLLEKQEQMMQSRFLKGISRRLGKKDSYWEESGIFEKVLSHFDGTDKAINVDVLKNLKESSAEKKIIFYRQMLHWVVLGEYKKRAEEIFNGKQTLN